MAPWSDLFPMAGVIEATKGFVATSRQEQSLRLLAGDHFMNVHICEPLVGRRPTISAVIAQEHPAHLDPGVEPIGGNGVNGDVTSSRLELRTGRESRSRAIGPHACQFFPAAVCFFVNR